MNTTNSAKKKIGLSILAVFFLFIFSYGLFVSRELIFGIKIKDVNLTDYLTTRSKIMDISGIAKNAKKLTLNGREIPVDEYGNFKDTISLLSGYNVVEIEAVDKFNKKDIKTYRVIYKNEATGLSYH